MSQTGITTIGVQFDNGVAAVTMGLQNERFEHAIATIADEFGATSEGE
ncbi:MULTISPECIES: hypothetical protein [unclassified Halorhabdus]|nr:MULTISPECIES: hypothetical protein [unclassified Halorhabdus]